MKLAMRRTGIDVIGDVPWGTHFCQFYETGQDLIDILVPYFKEGLDAGEFCMWVTSEPLKVDQATAALRASVPDLDDYINKGQIEILDYSQWYTRTGKFSADEVLKGWVDKLTEAQKRGFEGLRLSGNTFWLEKADWDDFTRYEETVNNVIGRYKMLAICTYSLQKCNALEILDVVANHQFALIKRSGRWEIIESVRHKKTEQALRESEEKLSALYSSMVEGVALHEIVYDDAGNPVDYVITDVNPSYEKITGFSRDSVLYKRASALYGTNEPPYLDVYARVASSGKPESFETYFEPMKKHFSISVFSPAKGKFATVFSDITERKQAEVALQDAHEELEVSAEELRQQNEELLCVQSALIESEARLRRLYESGLIGVIYWNMDGIITDANDKFLEMVGYSREDLTAGRIDWVNMTPPEYRHLDENSTIELKATGVNKEPFEKEYIRKDGIRVPIIVAGAMLDEARFNGVAFVLDITERKKAEEALKNANEELQAQTGELLNVNRQLKENEESLRQSEQRFRLALKNSPVNVAIQDRDLVYQWAYNQRTRRPEEIIGKTDEELFAPEDIEWIHDVKRTVLDTGTNVHVSKWLTSNGQRVFLDLHYEPIRNMDGEIVGIGVAAINLTEQELAKAALRESEEELQKSHDWFKALVQNLNSGVALIDEYGKFTIVNPAFLRMFGLSEDLSDIKNVNDQNWGQWQVFDENGTLLHVDDHPVRKAAMTGKPVRNKLVGVRLPSGGDLVMKSTLLPRSYFL